MTGWTDAVAMQRQLEAAEATAAEWQTTAEAHRVEAQIQRDRADAATRERDEARALVERVAHLANKAADTIAKLRESVEWGRGLKDAFRPYQERAVKAESEVARLTQKLADVRRCTRPNCSSKHG